SANSTNGGDLFASTNGGRTFSRRSTGYHYFENSGGDQGGYDNCLWVDPINPDRLIVGGIDLWRSIDGGFTFSRISSDPSVHADQHIIVNHPGFDGAGNRTLFIGNDGGVYRCTDKGGSGSSLNNN